MQQLLLAGLVGFWLASFGLLSATSALAAPGTVRAGSISAGAKPIQADTLPETNKYNPTLLARRQPQPIMAEPALPEEVVPLGPSGGLRMDNGGNGSLLDELEPPKPVVPSTRMIENPVMDEGTIAEMPAEPWSSGNWFASGSHYAEVEFVVFERMRGKRRREPFATDANTGRVLTAYNNTFGVEAGVRATLGQNLYRDYLNRDHSVEATFFGINQFQISDSLNGQGINAIAIAADTLTTDLSSNFLSYEVNYRIKTRLERDRMVMGPDGSWLRQYTHGHVNSLLIGLRHVTFDENFLLTGRQTGVDPTVFARDYRVNTENDLLGIQIGGESRSQYETWCWGVSGKAGAYVNFSEASRNVTLETVPVYAASPTLQDAAFVGELRIFGAYNLSPNWTLRSSFDIIGLAGIAQAPYNLDFSFGPRSDVINDGFVQLVGMSFGMEVVW